MENQYGKKSVLDVTISHKNGKNILENAAFTAPYKVMHPFYNSDGQMELMAASVSAGIMEGDEQSIAITIKDQATAKISSQSYEKIHKMQTGSAKRETHITIGYSASLDYSPLPVIPYQNSAFKSHTTVNLKDKTSSFQYSEIISGGRKAMGELFAYRYYHTLTNIYRKDQLIYRDNTRFEPANFKMEQIGMMEGYSHLLNMIIIKESLNKDLISQIRNLIEIDTSMQGGISNIGCDGINIRVLGGAAQALIALQVEITKITSHQKEAL